MNTAVRFAMDILQMQREIDHLHNEVERLKTYEQKYNDLLDGTIRHNEIMSLQVLELCLNGGEFKQQDRQELKS